MGSVTTAQLISSIVAIVLPIIVALVTNRLADGSVKAIVLLVLSAVSAFLSAWLVALTGGTTFDVGQALYTTLTTFVIAVASHFGLWAAVGITGSDGIVQNALPGGLGGRSRSDV